MTQSRYLPRAHANPANGLERELVTESDSVAPRRIGGSPAYVSAHEIRNRSDLSFEQAYALTKLVLEEGGGPVSCRGKGAVIKKPIETALVRRGLIEVQGSSDFNQRVYVELNVDGRVFELLHSKYAGITVIPKSVTERSKWTAVATQAAFDLVARYFHADLFDAWAVSLRLFVANYWRVRRELLARPCLSSTGAA